MFTIFYFFFPSLSSSNLIRGIRADRVTDLYLSYFYIEKILSHLFGDITLEYTSTNNMNVKKQKCARKATAIVCKPNCFISCELCELFNFFPMCTHVTLAFLRHIWSSGCFNIQSVIMYSIGIWQGTKSFSVHASFHEGFHIGNRLVDLIWLYSAPLFCLSNEHSSFRTLRLRSSKSYKQQVVRWGSGYTKLLDMCNDIFNGFELLSYDSSVVSVHLL